VLKARRTITPFISRVNTHPVGCRPFAARGGWRARSGQTRAAARRARFAESGAEAFPAPPRVGGAAGFNLLPAGAKRRGFLSEFAPLNFSAKTQVFLKVCRLNSAA
jgi:hypothetical protein